MRVLILLALTASFLLSVPALAQERMTAADLERLCSSASDLDYGYCAGYVTAVADEMTKGSLGDFRACGHVAVRSQQYIDIFKAYVAGHPGTRTDDADRAVAAAFARAFPCGSGAP